MLPAPPGEGARHSRLLWGVIVADVRRGLIIVNTGPGKGKTTAAMGTALRAVGNGLKVLMLQFLKGSWHYGELDAVKAFGDNFVMKQMGRGFIKVGGAETDPEDVRLVEEAWAEAEEAILSGRWDLVVRFLGRRWQIDDARHGPAVRLCRRLADQIDKFRLVRHGRLPRESLRKGPLCARRLNEPFPERLAI